MATIENFLLKFKVDGQQAIDKASASVKNLSGQVAGLGTNLGPLGDSLGDVVGRLGPLAGAAGAAGLAFAALGLKAVSLADEIGDISDATGISAGALLNFKQSLIEAGGKSEDFSTLAAKLNQNIGEAANGSEKAQKAFKALGVFVTDAGGNVRSTEEILRDAISRLAAIEDPAVRAAMAIDLFGKNAAKLDFTKLTAFRDPVADADIKRLAEYQAAIDKVRNSLESKLISFFGSLAQDIDKSMQKMQELEKQANARGNTRNPLPGGVGPAAAVVNPFGIGAPAGERPLTAQEQEALRLREMERLMAPAAGKPRGRTQEAIDAAASATGGGFGKTPESVLKAQAEAAKRIALERAELERNIALRSANQIQAVEINAAAEIAKAREEIFSRENISDALKTQEFALKRQAIEAKSANDIAKIRSDQAKQSYQVEEEQRQQAAKDIADFENRLQKAAEAARLQSVEYNKSTTELEKQMLLSQSLRGLSENEANIQRQIADELIRRTRALEELARIENLTYEERLKREAEITASSEKAIELIRKRGEEEYAYSRQFSTGWAEAYRKYLESAYDSAEQARNLFSTFTRGMEDSIVNFVRTGKLSFKDLANTILEQIIRIQVQRASASLFGGQSGGGLLGGIFSGIGKIFGFANGGEPPVGRPSLVGERGPELFIPRSAGTIIPNGASMAALAGGGETVVTYNIQAVDAASFRNLVARDPQFLFQVTEKGRRSQPTRSR